ncbi:MAG: ABC transporter substrate-binding protein, partial [Bdellovibrionales bacterium]|nr:ABC transporter substrate-binding protein [Bdellovibrionales bacterium]
TEVVAPLSERKKVPTLAFSMSPHGKDREYVVTFGNPIENGIGAVHQYFQEKKAKQPGILSVNLGNALEAIDMLQKEIPHLHPIELVKSELTDFRSLISRLKSSKADALFVLLLPEQSLSFAKQAKQLHFDVPIIGGDVWADEQLTAELHKHLSQVAYVYGDVDRAFIDTYREKYGNASYIFEAACGYEVLSILSSLPSDWKSQPLAQALKASTPQHSVLPGLEYEERAGFGPHYSSKVRVYEIAD